MRVCTFFSGKYLFCVEIPRPIHKTVRNAGIPVQKPEITVQHVPVRGRPDPSELFFLGRTFCRVFRTVRNRPCMQTPSKPRLWNSGRYQ